MPVEELRSLGKTTAADAQRLAAAQAALAAGQEIPDDLVTDEDAGRGFEMVAKLIVGWRVYDPRVIEGDQPLLPVPATPALVGVLPQEILMRIMEEVGKANPQRTPAAGTGRTS